uniref:Three-Finger Toxin 08 n=1 Tax=Boiga dendrophila TaxID=46286 RepID=A0A481MQJ6_BOIDE
MKTLLLALAVVAFVCLGSADQLGLARQPNPLSSRCFECTAENFWPKCLSTKQCPVGYHMCYTLFKPHEKLGTKWAVKGCAKTCPTAGPNEIVNCCLTHECNRIFK